MGRDDAKNLHVAATEITEMDEMALAKADRDLPPGTQDAVFGNIDSQQGPNFRGVSWMGATMLMLKVQIGLGVLTLPSAFSTLGLVPGIIGVLFIGTIATWSNYIIGPFKKNHPDTYAIDDVGRIIFGRWGQEVLATMFVLWKTFAAGSGMLAISVSLNAVSVHGTCTAVFTAVSAVAVFLLASLRTLGKIQWLAWVGVMCILISVWTLAISVGLTDRPAAAPQTGPWDKEFKVVGTPTFTQAVSALTQIIFAYCGTPAFFPIASEMKDQRLYTRAVLTCQTVVTITYVVVSIIVYCFCGQYVASPALGSAGPLLKRITYGIAIPGLVVGAVMSDHMAAKYIFVRMLRGTHHLAQNTVRHWVTWYSCITGCCLFSYIIASAIPIFSKLVSLLGALFATFMAMQPMGCMWLYDNWTKDTSKRTVRWKFMVFWSVLVIITGWFFTIAGTYSAIDTLIAAYKKNGGAQPWGCADNSNSVRKA